jgi:hypothetical protein
MSWNFFFPQIDKIKLETGLPFLLQQIFTMQHFCINIQALGARFLGHWIGRDDQIVSRENYDVNCFRGYIKNTACSIKIHYLEPLQEIIAVFIAAVDSRHSEESLDTD